MSFYRLIWKATRLFAKIRNNLTIINPYRSVCRQGIVLVANHASFYDPVLLGDGLYRPVIFLAKQELYENPVMAWFLKNMGCVSLKRDGTDLEATRLAIHILRRKKALGLFIEGTRSEDGRFHRERVKSGFVRIAHRTDSLIQPVGISGTYEAFPRSSKQWLPAAGNVTIRFGEPFKVQEMLQKNGLTANREGYEFLTRLVCDRIEELRFPQRKREGGHSPPPNC